MIKLLYRRKQSLLHDKHVYAMHDCQAQLRSVSARELQPSTMSCYLNAACHPSMSIPCCVWETRTSWQPLLEACNPTHRYPLGHCLLSPHQPSTCHCSAVAAQLYSQALALRPGDAQLRCNRCLVLLRLAEFADAAADARLAVQVGTTDTAAPAALACSGDCHD